MMSLDAELPADSNELLTEVGRGRPMGDLMRQYWIPALMSSELPGPDCDPVRVLLLGEKLIAFRNTDGDVGLLRNSCPHRGASLFFGRVEDGCLRCVYHGWKYDTAGTCVEMPNVPPETDFKERLPRIGYPCREQGGMVWAYLGEREVPPELPRLEPLDYPADQVFIDPLQLECNWLQVMEGDVDTVHLSFLHAGHGQPGDAPRDSFLDFSVRDRPVKFQVVDTEYGVLAGAHRPAGDTGDVYWRIASFAFPFYTFIPTGVLGTKAEVLISVPMDDTHVMRYFLAHFSDSDGEASLPSGQTVGLEPDPTPLRENTTDWYGRWRSTKTMANDYGIDRDLQRSGKSFTGITGFVTEDSAMTEGMGPILDRGLEHLCSTDRMVVRIRRRLLRAALELRDEGVIPPGVDDPEAYFIRSGGIVLPPEADWIEATARYRQAGIVNADLDPGIAGGG
jgi:phthalate 4,5-dioxygenase oxygenase subunit